VVTDAYHHQKELVFDTEAVELMQLSPCGIGEATVREVVSIPESMGGVKTVSFLSGDVKTVKSRIEGGKNIVEGQVEAHLVCLSDDEKPIPFDMTRQLPFRISMDLPAGENPGRTAVAAPFTSIASTAPLPDNDVILKELRFDRLNDRQIELNAAVQVNGAVIRKKQCPLIRNVGFLEEGTVQKERPGLVLYITRTGDTLWKIARKYRTTIDAVAKINQIETDSPLETGTKLLIVK
ncbi:MAG: LysM peptidoglycan-binding domain-containing protein, partial [Firmicutes bacterium]|nr:LysM peptidoglycan-binding domain-containing protein [Bacillota bacterium]